MIKGCDLSLSTMSSSEKSTANNLWRAGVWLLVAIRRLYGGPLLSRQGAQSLILWTYEAEPDPSFLAPYLMPVWTRWAHLLPTRLSPNVVSLSSLLIAVVMFLYVQLASGGATGWEIPDAKSPALPWWFFPTAAVIIWAYQTADALDGRQGKRVGMYAHPSTELFDHGVDSIMTSFLGITMAAALRLGHNQWTALFILGTWTIFYSATWEHLNTGRMRFPSGLLNPTEGLVAATMACILTGVFPTIWETTLGELVMLILRDEEYWSLWVPSCVWALPVKYAVVFNLVINAVLALVSSVCQVWRSPRPHASSIASLAMPSLLPLALVWVWTLSIFILDGYLMVPRFRQYGRLLLHLGAFAWNYSVLMLIVCELTKSKYPAKEVIRTSFLLLFIGPFVMLLQPGLLTVIFLKLTVAVSILWYFGMWLQFLHELVHYCGMESWYAVQPWPDGAPNVARLKDEINFLGEGGGDISEWKEFKDIQQSRIEALKKGKIVELLN